ncbi:hypothetical protein QFC22_004444 [Naganishia vaughanmartiniae]|uniref:Uncharacterized protein n=1 Tax=Naganishia vaughanmartiniae TaxID=1424756 RepID=A0ACC2X0K4_9TREE|nr:hypothetical protein QFC22_004444 [Naganishia vaughanmartiniae]
MSKRTLDSFLLPPPTSSSSINKRTKRDPPNHSPAHVKSKSNHAVPKSSTKKNGNGIEVVDLDEVIDLDTPSPSLSGSMVLPDGQGTDAALPYAGEDENGEVLPGEGSDVQHPGSAQDLRHTSNPQLPLDKHPNYPFPIPHLPLHITTSISCSPFKTPTALTHLPHLDLLHYEPYLDAKTSREYGEFLRRELPFYRVEYKLTRFGKVADIKTPRYTTVFGVDETSRFTPDGGLVETASGRPIAKTKYKTARPRPIPTCLDELRKVGFMKNPSNRSPQLTLCRLFHLSCAPVAQSVEKATGTTYNYALVNYYSTGSDSISYHSDDEHFLERQPAIASFSFLGVRDFLMKHKPISGAKPTTTTTAGDTFPSEPTLSEISKAAATPLKFSLRPGTMILMRGPTQSNWLHSIPKRAGDGGGGRINITFRRNMTPAGTENYYKYNVGGGGVWKWDEARREMRSYS